MNEKKCFPRVGSRISFLYIFCSSSTIDNALFTFLFFYFLEKMSILYFWEIPFPLYPPSLHFSPPPVCLQAFLRILVPSKLSWRWCKRLLAVKLLFKGHFLINAADKVIAEHSMQRRKIYPFRKLPPTVLTHSAGSIPSNRVLIKHYLTYPSLLGSMKSSGRICFYGWDHVWYFTLNPLRSSNTLQIPYY